MPDQCPVCGRMYFSFAGGHTPNGEVCLANQMRDMKKRADKQMIVADAIKQEAEECAKSSKDHRNSPKAQEIFHVLSIVLGGIAERINNE